MVFFNYSTMQMAAKVVYYGPGLCGKTTNLHYIYGHTTNDSRGEMVSLETETDRTLFFDLLPLDVGSIAGFNTRIQLYTVPGQVFYNTTRKLVLKGVDGVVFVVDSQRAMLQANLDSFRNLEENLTEMGLSVDSLPLVLQYNKRDLADICTVEELNQAVNRQGWPWYEASAVSGQGVFETLKGISKYTLLALKKRLGRSGADAPARLSAAAAGPPGSAGTSGSAGPASQPPRPAAEAVAAAPPAAAAVSRPSAGGPSPVPLPDGPPPAVAGSGAAAAAAPAPEAPLARSSPTSPSAPPAATAPPSPTAAALPPAPSTERAALAVSAARPAHAAAPAAATASSRSTGKTSTGKNRPVDVLGELEKLRREAMQPTAVTPVVARPPQGPRPPEPDRELSAPSPTSPGRRGAAAAGGGAAKAAAGNGRTELSRNIELTLKRSEFARARRFLLSFQVEDEQHRVVDAVRDLQVEIKDTADIEKLLLRFNIALHAKE